jgi:ectoine hydroxylase-related dioxygenase (phytanoyl-CoA dioxygenase family)
MGRISKAQIEQYNKQGFLVMRELFTAEEVAFFKRHYEAMRLDENAELLAKIQAEAGEPAGDPLTIYPRIMQPHRRDEASLKWLIDNRLNEVMITLLGQEPFAVQTMFYFKPPGARGQALHQDQYYLRVQPGTCMAAWMAVDDCDEENGCLRVVPGSHTWPLLCLTEADTRQSFTDVTVPLPEGVEAVAVTMQAGDVLFFNGQLVHGSLPNRSQDRFRRALIGHYIVGEAQQVYEWYHPVLQMDGRPVEMGLSEVGGTCGIWVDESGANELEMQVEVVNQHIFGKQEA